jgi:serine/threonine protein kinase
MGDPELDFIGRYQLLEEIGAGGMAVVYKALHPGLQRQVAVKVLKVTPDEKPSYLARFRREAVTVARLDHPHIVRIYDFDVVDERPFLVMALIEGPTLQTVLAEKAAAQTYLSFTEIGRIFQELATAVTCAHEQEITHRDLKPGNILFDQQGKLYLTDFGLARMPDATNHTEAGTLMGTLAYMSPEQCRGHAADYRSDIYALGIILYELLSGRPPFREKQPTGFLFKHIFEPPPPPLRDGKPLPAAIEQIVLKALLKEPADRHQSVAEMAGLLQKALAGTGGLPSTQVVSAAETPPKLPLPVQSLFTTPAINPPVGSDTIQWHHFWHDLRAALLDCGPFESHSAMEALFQQPPLAVWREQLPRAGNISERLERLIDYLLAQYDVDGRNGLVLFLEQVRVSRPLSAPCARRLSQLTGKLQMELGRMQETPPSLLPEKAVTAVLYHAPGIFEKPDYLFGRDRLLRLTSRALKHFKHLLLQGMGGSGKTALAATLADAELAQPEHSVLWVQAGQEDAAAIVEAIVTALQPTAAEKQQLAGSAPPQKMQIIRALLQRNNVSLVVLDDVWLGSAMRVLKVFPPQLKSIVTSRMRFARVRQIIDVGDLTPPAALQLLAYHAAQPELLHDEAARELCALLGYHAFATEIAGNILLVDQLTPRQLLQRVQWMPHQMQMPDGGSETGRDSVHDLLEESYENLPTAEKEVFLALGALFSPSATAPLLVGFIDELGIDVQAALRTLVRRGLAKQRPA